MTDYDRFVDYTTYGIDLIRHERSVKCVISNGACTVLTDIAPLIWLISRVFNSPCLTNKEQITSEIFNLFMHLPF